MSKVNVVIIEDEFFAAEELWELLISLGYHVDGIYHSGEKFMKTTNWDFDLAIIDIFLSGKLTGLDIAKELTTRHKDFVFLTANQDLKTLKDAARFNPRAYISKPFKPNDVTAVLEIISQKLIPKLEVKGLHGAEYVHPDDILFVKSDGAYIEIQTLKGKIIQRKLLKEIAKELPQYFVRVHRSYIVNTKHIDHASSLEVVIRKHHLPLSRTYKQELQEFLNR